MTLAGAERQEFTSSPAPTYKPASSWPFAKYQKPETLAQTLEDNSQTEEETDQQDTDDTEPTTSTAPDSNSSDEAAGDE